MENISLTVMNSTFSTTPFILPNTTYSKLEPFCLWLMNTKYHIPLMCKEMIGMDMDQYQSRAETGFMSNRHASQYEHSSEHSFDSGRGIVGTLGSVLLILLLIAMMSCALEHKRIQV